MKQLLIIILLTATVKMPVENFKVEYTGALMEIMHKGDISSRVALSSLKKIPHLYALGMVENLKGEITVLDSKPLIAQVVNDQPKLSTDLNVNASLLVYADVADWITINIPDNIKTREQLEDFLPEIAKQNGINNAKPFPFRLEGIFAEANWQVVDWKENDNQFNFAKYTVAGLTGKMINEPVSVIGFYSQKHQHVWTFHDTYIHAHVWFAQKQIAAHLYNFSLAGGTKLLLPKVAAQ